MVMVMVAVLVGWVGGGARWQQDSSSYLEYGISVVAFLGR